MFSSPSSNSCDMIRVEDLNSMQSQGQNLRTIDPKRGLTLFTVLLFYFHFGYLLYQYLNASYIHSCGSRGRIRWAAYQSKGQWTEPWILQSSGTEAQLWVQTEYIINAPVHLPWIHTVPESHRSHFQMLSKLAATAERPAKMVSSKSVWLHASTWSTVRFLLFLTECQISSVSDLVQKYINFKSCILTQNVKRLNY